MDSSYSDDIIKIEHLTKIFSNKKIVKAVDDISLSVRHGEIFGLLGPNGAGKSTIIRILTTLLKPTSGKAYLKEYDVTKEPEKIRSLIGVCPQNGTLDIELTAYDNLEFYGKLLNVDDLSLEPRIWELLEMSNLKDRAHQQVRTFSGGMKRKLEIVRAFIHKPLILFLDEPTIGLDPESRREVWEQVLNLNTHNTTIILTTHYMDEAERLCDRIAFVDQGRLISLDTPDNLKKALPSGDRIEIGFTDLRPDLIASLQNNPLISSVEVKGKTLCIFSKSGNKVLPSLLTTFEQYSHEMLSITIRSPTIEDVFIYLTGNNLSNSGDNSGINAIRGAK